MNKFRVEFNSRSGALYSDGGEYWEPLDDPIIADDADEAISFAVDFLQEQIDRLYYLYERFEQEPCKFEPAKASDFLFRAREIKEEDN